MMKYVLTAALMMATFAYADIPPSLPVGKGCNAISSPSLLLSIASLLSGLALVARRRR